MTQLHQDVEQLKVKVQQQEQDIKVLETDICNGRSGVIPVALYPPLPPLLRSVLRIWSTDEWPLIASTGSMLS